MYVLAIIMFDYSLFCICAIIFCLLIWNILVFPSGIDVFVFVHIVYQSKTFVLCIFQMARRILFHVGLCRLWFHLTSKRYTPCNLLSSGVCNLVQLPSYHRWVKGRVVKLFLWIVADIHDWTGDPFITSEILSPWRY